MSDHLDDIKDAVIDGKLEEIEDLVKAAIEDNVNINEIVNRCHDYRDGRGRSKIRGQRNFRAGNARFGRYREKGVGSHQAPFKR